MLVMGLSGLGVPARCAALLVAVSLLAPRFAIAESSFWDRVKDPKLAEQEQLQWAAERSRASESELIVDAALDRLLARRTAILIELAGGGEHSPLELRFLYGESLVRAALGGEEQGKQLLLAALREAPDSPLKAKAWAAVAKASMMQGAFGAGERAYCAALAEQWQPEMRALLLLHRGNSRMQLRDIVGGIADYQHALALTGDPQVMALAHWGLGVGYDRDDNFPLARREIEQAISINVGTPAEPRWAIDSSEVELFPAHEEHYYRALGLTVQALAQADPVLAGASCKRATAQWDGYLLAGQAADDPWLKQARRNRARCAQSAFAPK
jgi:tetratricopeptide (TPR) repeat protein